MTTLVGATEAARILGVTKPTLYAYVSRGLVERRVAVDGRTSLYDREQLETVAGQRRRRSTAERPSIDVQIGSSITVLEDTGVHFRGHDAVELARIRSFEAVGELLWSGTLPDHDPTWRVDRDDLARCRAVIDAAGLHDPIARLTLAVSALQGAEDDETNSAVPTARRLLAVAPTLLGGPQRGTVAERTTRAWVRRPSDALTDAVGRALVLLADHELATSTLAVRVAASVRTAPAAALACGLATVGGRLHGRAATEAVAMLRRAVSVGAGVAVGERLDDGGRLPGFGHSVYKAGDPRFVPLFETVLSLPDPNGFGQVAQDVLAESARRIDRLPNVDFALAALHLIGGLPADAPLFALARIAGWAAHYDEELTERPVRYRGMARAPHINLVPPR